MAGMDYYPYPPALHRIEPFDTGVDDAQYVILGGSTMTYAFTDRDGGYGVDLYDVIPMGYKILRFAQKVAVVHGRQVRREWPLKERNERAELHTPVKGTHDPADWLHEICGYVVLTARSSEKKVGGDHYDYQAALATAHRATKENGRAVILYVYDGQDWH
jgi:hypothetical protein